MTGAKTHTARLHRVQQGHRRGFVTAAPSVAAPVHRPARIALMLALAHKIRARIDHGQLADQAEAARRLGLTRARITQLFALLQLAPDLQERILLLEAVDGVEPLAERQLRPLVRSRSWAEQRAAFDLVGDAQ